jgi:DNA repair/transcription protein MET18/MMS19
LVDFTDENLQYEPGGEAERFMCDTSAFGTSPSRESDIRAAIGAILANKYKGIPSSSGPDVMKRVLDFWGDWLKEATTTSPLDPATFSAYNTIAINVIAGAVARQDKHIPTLIPTLHTTLTTPHPNSELLAQSLGLLLKQNPLLTAENHALVKRFHKQWAYTHLVKPLLQPAQPAASNDAAAAAAATRSRVAVLAAVANCPFTVYQDDLPLLIRLLVTALSSSRKEIASEEVAWSQVVCALEILVDILGNEPEALRGYLREVIGGVTGVYQVCAERKQGGRQGAVKTVCRRLALQVLGAIPTRFEERHVLVYAPPTQRMLAVACGDPVRRVREVARAARASWARVV